MKSPLGFGHSNQQNMQRHWFGTVEYASLFSNQALPRVSVSRRMTLRVSGREVGIIVVEYVNVKVHGMIWGRVSGGTRSDHHLLPHLSKDPVLMRRKRQRAGYRFSVLSNKSFASLILLARYGAPPRSGWLASIICLCASLIFILRAGPSLKRSKSSKPGHSQNIERETHLIPRMERASFRSILALKPPLAHSWAAPLPPMTPLLKRVRPAMAAAIAPTPRMIGVDIVGG